MPHPDFDAEAQHLSGTVDAMLRAIARLEDRERNAGADGHASLVQADQAELEAQALSPQVHAPYFGSLRVRAAGRTRDVYVGKHAFLDTGGPHGVISWLSPVGALFYSEGTGLPKGELLRKRQLDVRDKRLHDLTDLYLPGGDAAAGRETVLLRRLEEAASSGMRDVIETLQPEQDAIMRCPAGQPAIVQGAAGSGKTTIGFHRLAWLAHPDRAGQRAAPDACLVLMPNPVLAAYAARVLPTLALEGVQVTTPERWMVGQLGIEKLEVVDRTLQLLLTDPDSGRRKAAWLRAKALGDARMLEVVRRHLGSRHRAALGAQTFAVRLEVRGRRVPVEVSTATLREILDGVLAALPREGARAALAGRVQQRVLDEAGVPEDETLLAGRLVAQDLQPLLTKVFRGPRRCSTPASCCATNRRCARPPATCWVRPSCAPS